LRGGFPVDWKRIKAEYIAGGTSYRKLAEKYSVPFGTLRRVAKREGWTQKRTQVEHKTDTKMMEQISDDAAEKAVNIIDVADKLLDKISEFVEAIPLESMAATQALKHLTSALKDLKEIKGYKSNIDLREQEARIRNLEKQAETDNTSKDIEVQFGSDVEGYSQ
jgi:uncharacterized protein YjcR